MKKPRVCVLGPGKRFISGISYYTIRLVNALSDRYSVSVILLRNLVPKFLFPGGKRVGQAISALEVSDRVSVYDGIDWYWMPGVIRVPGFLKAESPHIIVFQWWTSTIAHTVLLLIIIIRFMVKDCRLVLTFHETLDPLENAILPLRIYARWMGKLIFPFFDAYVTHSESDRDLIHSKYRLSKSKIHVVVFGSFDHVRKERRSLSKSRDVCALIFFGLIRPYKGVEYLVEAFSRIPEDLIHRFTLTIVGEPWGDEIPRRRIQQSPYKDRIRYVNRYVTDDEVDAYFQQADVAVFPYTRASQSAAAHTAISYGLPIIVSEVGGLKESMAHYEGTIFVEPKNVRQLTEKILSCWDLRKKRFENPHSWEKTVECYARVFDTIS